ncbi:MAG: helix-turn-helix transcriptional regulator [Deltaproteobacteria bacterium]|nr:helix-turn-helix transcriptional regulator [Deltaproteobacteria bacterium]
MFRYLFLGFVRIHILYHAAEEPIFGTGIMAELASHGYRLSPGTLYPLLHDLERRGYLSRENKVVGGRVRKYYRATPAGKAALEEARVKAAELTAEIME